MLWMRQFQILVFLGLEGCRIMIIMAMIYWIQIQVRVYYVSLFSVGNIWDILIFFLSNSWGVVWNVLYQQQRHRLNSWLEQLSFNWINPNQALHYATIILIMRIRINLILIMSVSLWNLNSFILSYFIDSL
jgi:hypothetical protein